MDWMNEWKLTLHILFAVFLGGIIGLERESRRGLAGIRTHAMVALGACLFGFISFNIKGYNSSMGLADPSRIAAQIVTGIGFLGAGVILREQGHVRGLTTAASIWATASIGLAVANCMYLLAIASTLIILVLLYLHRIQWWRKGRKKILPKKEEDEEA